MALPFSREAFLDVFGAYNASFWPVAVVLWVATTAAFIAHLAGRGRGRLTLGLLAVEWAWAGVAYHAILFSRINPAARGFAALFLVEAGLLAWCSVRHGRLEFSRGTSVHECAGYVLVTYGLLYPLIALVGPDSYPRIPTFGVPCPTTIVTVGFLLLVSQPVPRTVIIVPLLWTVVGGSAAFMLGMRLDLALLAAGVSLAFHDYLGH